MKKILILIITLILSLAIAYIDKGNISAKDDFPNTITGGDSYENLPDVKTDVKTAVAVVSYIVDGDTFSAKVKIDNDIKITVKVRIMNIDTPEIHGECPEEIKMAMAAKARLSELIPKGTVVNLSGIKDDKYLGRIDAFVKKSDGLDIGAIMIQEKQARPYSGGRRQPWCETNEQ